MINGLFIVLDNCFIFNTIIQINILRSVLLFRRTTK